MSKEIIVTVQNKLGLHVRPAAKLVNVAKTFKSEIIIEKNGEKANAKSIMAIISFAAAQGTSLKIIANGEDEQIALDSLNTLFIDKFGEE